MQSTWLSPLTYTSLSQLANSWLYCLWGDIPDCFSVISDSSCSVPSVSQVLTYIIMDLWNQHIRHQCDVNCLAAIYFHMRTNILQTHALKWQHTKYRYLPWHWADRQTGHWWRGFALTATGDCGEHSELHSHTRVQAQTRTTASEMGKKKKTEKENI